MISREEQYRLNILILLHHDVENLFSRIRDNSKEYLKIYSLKRTREHFKEVFKSRYHQVSFSELKLCSKEIIINLNAFYKNIDSLHWYLMSTEDLPSMVENSVHATIKEIEPYFKEIVDNLSGEIHILENHLSSEHEEGVVGSELAGDANENLDDSELDTPFNSIDGQINDNQVPSLDDSIKINSNEDEDDDLPPDLPLNLEDDELDIDGNDIKSFIKQDLK